MKSNIRNICDLLLGLLFITSVICGYYKDISHMGEYCFISGLLVGAIFVISSVCRMFQKKEFPVWLYFDCMISTIIILIATIAIRLNLEGAFWFIHIINPLVLFCYWLVCCDHGDIHDLRMICTAVVFPVCYFIFAFILYKAAGMCPFPASLLLVDCSAGQTALGVGLIILLFIVLGYAFHFLNQAIHRVSHRNGIG